MPEVVLASTSSTLRRAVSHALSDHGLGVTTVSSGAALGNLATGERLAETRVAVIDLDLPGLTDLVVRQVSAESQPATAFILLWNDPEDLRRLSNVTLPGQSRLIPKESHTAGHDKTEAFLSEVTERILDFASSKHGTRIQDVIIETGRDILLIVFRNGRSYRLRKKLMPGLDKTRIVTARPNEDGSAFLVRQESGNTSEIPWDFVLYHLEHDYPYYKGRGAGKRSKAAAAQRIARRVKEVRTRLGLTASALAARSGIQRPNISRIESGRHMPSLDTLERLAEALGVPVAELVRL